MIMLMLQFRRQGAREIIAGVFANSPFVLPVPCGAMTVIGVSGRAH